jgi:gamma-glutamyltranspeptidase
MWQDYSELGWHRLFEPAVGIAENGFAPDAIATNWIGAAFPCFPENARIIYGNGGIPLRSGSVSCMRSSQTRCI